MSTSTTGRPAARPRRWAAWIAGGLVAVVIAAEGVATHLVRAEVEDGARAFLRAIAEGDVEGAASRMSSGRHLGALGRGLRDLLTDPRLSRVGELEVTRVRTFGRFAPTHACLEGRLPRDDDAARGGEPLHVELFLRREDDAFRVDSFRAASTEERAQGHLLAQCVRDTAFD